MYVGESEKNVRKIFDTFYDLCEKTKSEPILLLNEADQFLGARSSGNITGSDQMHNQMQNIKHFLEDSIIKLSSRSQMKYSAKNFGI